MRQREWEEKGRWVGVDVVGETLLLRFAELEGLISIRKEKDVHKSLGSPSYYS